MWNECVKIDMKWLDFVRECAHNRERWRSLITGNHPTLPQCGYECVVLTDCVETVRHCLSAVMSVWFLTDCVL